MVDPTHAARIISFGCSTIAGNRRSGSRLGQSGLGATLSAHTDHRICVMLRVISSAKVSISRST